MGRYTTTAIIQMRAGIVNADSYADRDNDNAADPGAYDAAIEYAEDRVDAEANEGEPFEFEDPAVVNRVVREWATILALWWLDDSRGSERDGRWDKLYEDVLAQMARYAAGEMVLGGVVTTVPDADEWGEVDAPISALPTVDPHGRELSDPPPVGYYWDHNAGTYRIQ